MGSSSYCLCSRIVLFNYFLSTVLSFVNGIFNLLLKLFIYAIISIFIPTYFLGQDSDLPTIKYTVPGCLYSMSAYSNLCSNNLHHNPSWFRIRLRISHTVIYPYFVCASAGTLLLPRFKTIFFCISCPFLPITNITLCWTYIAISCIGLLYMYN